MKSKKPESPVLAAALAAVLAPVPSDGIEDALVRVARLSDAEPFQDRKVTYRERREAEGLVQVSAWVPAAAAPDFYVIAERLRKDRDLGFGPLRHVPTGRLRKL